MPRKLRFMLPFIFAATTAAAFAKDYELKPVAFTEVRITDHFWLPRLQTNQQVTIPYAFQKCETTGRIDNFAIAGGLKSGKFRSRYPFDDSDVYKIIEGASYSLILQPNPKLANYLDSLIALIAAAQEDDGYLQTWRTIDPQSPPTDWSGNERWGNLENGHELYNVGHSYEAAVAHYLATGKRTFLDVALKNANLIYEVFGPGKKNGYPGHQEIEIGLVKLYRLTQDPRYLELAQTFLDRRGQKKYDQRRNPQESGRNYQDHLPVIEQTAPVGHAVRAGYMYTGMADIAALTGNTAYSQAISRIWESMIGQKYYLTGGVGSTSNAEAYGEAYDLPNREAYCETCAAIALVLWNHRMFLLTGDAKYIDVLERTLYNGLISGVSLAGDQFFYPNPLESNGHDRSEWFACACCPSNICRFMPSVSGYIYAQRAQDLFVNLYIGSEGTLKIGGKAVKISQQTDYPWSGDIRLTLQPETRQTFTLLLRIPGWTQNQPVPSDLYHYLNPAPATTPVIKVNGKDVVGTLARGYLQIQREWRANDVVTIHFPMHIQRVLAHEKVTADQGKVALEYGPIVYCAEWVDNQGKISNLILPDTAALAVNFRADLLHGVNTITGRVPAFYPSAGGNAITTTEQAFTAIPYYAWAHRGKGEMSVWLPRKVANLTIQSK